MKKTILILVIAILLFIEFIITVSPGEIKLIEANVQPTSSVQLPINKLQIVDIKVGNGREVKPGDTVAMHYKGTLTNGKEFDSSYKRNQPFETTIGTGQVIKGWDQGVPGMKIGGKRKLTIPPELGYGPEGSPPVIPPNATLIFEVELLDIK